MSAIDRKFRLAQGAGDIGLECTLEGLSLGGASLLRATSSGLASRPDTEVHILLKAAFGGDFDSSRVPAGLDVVADALNRGELGRAMIAALRLSLPELDWTAAVRVARAEDRLQKQYNPQEPRDWHGRWTTGGGTSAAKPVPPNRKPTASPCGLPGHKPNAGESGPSFANRIQALRTLYPRLQSEFDDLGATAFSKKVIDFGLWVEQQAHDGRPFDRLGAQAEYTFLQDRLSFWLGYPNTEPNEHAYLLGAADYLYVGAVNAGLIDKQSPDNWPRSMDEVALTGTA